MVRIRARGGFTLSELMIVMLIVGIIALIAPRLMIQAVRFYQLHNAKVEVQRDARVSLDLINRQLRQAQNATVSIDQYAGQPPYSRITFQLPSSQVVQFYQKGSQLFQVQKSTAVLSNNLQYIAFTYPRTDDPTIISVSITMAKATFEGGTKALELSIEKVRVMN